MDEEFISRRRWFDDYFKKIEQGIITTGPEWIRYTCPCCGYPTLSRRNYYEICDLCWWEDDGQDDEEADNVWGGPNQEFSLTKARENFKKYLNHFDPKSRPDFHYPVHWKRRVDFLKRKLIETYRRIMAEPDFQEHPALWNEERALIYWLYEVEVDEKDRRETEEKNRKQSSH